MTPSMIGWHIRVTEPRTESTERIIRTFRFDFITESADALRVYREANRAGFIVDIRKVVKSHV